MHLIETYPTSKLRAFNAIIDSMQSICKSNRVKYMRVKDDECFRAVFTFHFVFAGGLWVVSGCVVLAAECLAYSTKYLIITIRSVCA